MNTAANTNLDAMTHDELIAFITDIGQGVRPIAAARQLFPNSTKGIVTATRQLRNYAWNKATAITCRKNGDIPTALRYEAICDRIYRELPDWARGW